MDEGTLGLREREGRQLGLPADVEGPDLPRDLQGVPHGLRMTGEGGEHLVTGLHVGLPRNGTPVPGAVEGGEQAVSGGILPVYEADVVCRDGLDAQFFAQPEGLPGGRGIGPEGRHLQVIIVSEDGAVPAGRLLGARQVAVEDCPHDLAVSAPGQADQPFVEPSDHLAADRGGPATDIRHGNQGHEVPEAGEGLREEDDRTGVAVPGGGDGQLAAVDRFDTGVPGRLLHDLRDGGQVGLVGDGDGLDTLPFGMLEKLPDGDHSIKQRIVGVKV